MFNSPMWRWNSVMPATNSREIDWVVERQIALDDIGDEFGLARREQLAADLGGKADIGLERLLRLDQRAHGGRDGLGIALRSPRPT